MNIQNYKNSYDQHLNQQMRYNGNMQNDVTGLNVKNKKLQPSFNNASNPAFKGNVGSYLSLKGNSFMRFLATNMAWGAIFIDFFCMDAPRTLVDFVGRGTNAGVETGIREGSGTVNHSLIGTYGLGAAAVAALALNNKYGVKAGKIFASDETTSTLGKFWHDAIRENATAVTSKDEKVKASGIDKTLDKYLNNVFSNVEGYAPGKKDSLWKKLPDEDKAEFVAKYKDYLTKLASKDGVDKKLTENLKSYTMSKFGSSLGTDSSIRISSEEGASVLHSSTFVSNLTKLTKAFMSDKVQKEFLKADKFEANEFIKSLKHLNTKISIIGIGIASLIGMSIQPLNRYRTKKKTGSDNFVGGGKPDKSKSFKMLKMAAAGAFAAGAIATIDAKNLFKKPGILLKKLQFKGLSPTIEQFKFIYGVTIASRLASSRTGDELRESLIKDILGFTNWLILGNVVALGVAKIFEKHSKLAENNFIKYPEPGKKGFFSSSLVSRNEVLFKALKKAGINTIKEDGKAMSFGEMLKALPKADKETRTKLRYLNYIQLAGYVYSGLVLGVGIPKLNIAIKKHKDKKKAEAEKLAKQNQSNQQVLTKPAELKLKSA